MRVLIFAAVFGVTSLLGATSLLGVTVAEAMHCHQRLVRPGDSGSRVLGLCGEPVDVVQRIETRSHTVQRVAPDGSVIYHSVAVTVAVERWTYDFGPQRLMRRLVFEDGVLLRIETLGYGTSGHSPR